jgi:glycosyltransferase involved in cell wall biosynthesis
LEEKYRATSRYIPYGATIYNNESVAWLGKYQVSPGEYYMLMARMEPENNIEMILDGYTASASAKKFIVIGNTNNTYGKQLKKKFGKEKNILFTGPLFDQEELHSLKFFSRMYFHGHSVGGTNPSLLEAMASRTLIAAHDNPFNRTILDGDAYYFSSVEEVKNSIDGTADKENEESMVRHNLRKIKEEYNWQAVIDQYGEFILECRDKK